MAQGWVACAGWAVRLAGTQCFVLCIKKESGPLRLRKGPRAAARDALHRVARSADFDFNLRFVLPPIVDVVEIMIKEPLLYRHILGL